MVLTDLDQARVDKGVGYVQQEIEKLVGKGRLDIGTAAKLRGLVSGSVDKSTFADADFVIEAVFEDLSVKKQVWAELEKIVSPEAVLATNTSSLSVTEMAAELAHPRAAGRLPLLQPGRGAAAAGDRPGRADRRCDVGDRVRGGQTVAQVLRAGLRRPGVRGQPATDPLPR